MLYTYNQESWHVKSWLPMPSNIKVWYFGKHFSQESSVEIKSWYQQNSVPPICGRQIQLQDSSKRKYKDSQPLWECVVGCRECSHLIWTRMGENQGKYPNLTHFLPLPSFPWVMRLWPWIPANPMYGTSLLGNRIGRRMRDKWKEMRKDILQVTSLTSDVHSLAFNCLT